MKHLPLILSAVLLGCAKSPPPPKPVATAEPTVVFPSAHELPSDQVIAFEHMNVTLPPGWVKDKSNEVGMSFVDAPNHRLILVAKNPCDLGYNKCMVSTIKSVKATGMNVLSATDVAINGSKFVLLTCHDNDANVFVWLSYDVKDKMLYLFACGGDEKNKDNEAVCKTIANTLKMD